MFQAKWMIPIWLFVAMLLASPFIGSAQPPAAPANAAPRDDERIAKLIKELSHDDFSNRETAQRELLMIGAPAEAALTEATLSKDVETSRRATFIVRELVRRKTADQVAKVTWSTAIDRVRQHAANDDWKKPGFNDDLLEGAVENLVSQVNLATKENRLKVPVKLEACQASRDPRERGGGPPGQGKLFCGKGSLQFSHATRSIFLVDGSVHVSFATDCLIIARGAVSVAHGQGNVILAGQFVDISHDGSRLRTGDISQDGASSLVMSGGILRMSHAQRAICSAPLELSVGATNCIALNPAKDAVQDLRGFTIAEVKLLLTPDAPPNPIRDQLKVTQVVNRGGSEGSLAIIEQGGVEIAIRVGSEIKDNLGKPIPELKGWKLDYVNEDYALFSNGLEDAGFAIPRRR